MEEKRISRDAAEWLVLQDRGLSPQQQDAFLHWLAADSRHGEWLALHRQSWQRLNRLAEWQPEHSGEPNPDLLALPRRRLRWLWPVGLAMAAGLAILLGGRFWTPPVAPEIIAVATPPVVSAVSAYERRVLEDGSVIELNRGARILVNYTPEMRGVTLAEGVAHFIVAKNPKRPFVVSAGHLAVRAVGTAFNVQISDDKIDVLVTEGKVHLESGMPLADFPGNDSMLAAGQCATIEFSRKEHAQVTTLSPEEVDRLMAWQPRVLDFNSVPLAQVVVAFNRHNAGQEQMLIVDADLALMQIVASFRSDNVNGFVRLLEVTSDVRVERAGSVIRLYRGGSPAREDRN